MVNLELYGYLFWYNGHEKLWYAIPSESASIFFSGYVDRNTYLSASHMDKLIVAVIEIEHEKYKETEFEKSKSLVDEVIICETCGREKVKDFDSEPGFDCHACL